MRELRINLTRPEKEEITSVEENISTFTHLLNNPLVQTKEEKEVIETTLNKLTIKKRDMLTKLEIKYNLPSLEMCKYKIQADSLEMIIALY